jgi:hypothetical protein
LSLAINTAGKADKNGADGQKYEGFWGYAPFLDPQLPFLG